MSEKINLVKDTRNMIDIFVDGARKGWTVGITSIMPNTLMAFVCIRIFNVTGVLDILGKVFAPVMGVFGLPGEGIIVLFTSLLSMGGGVGSAASLYSSGTLNAEHVTIVMPAIFLMGAKIQYVGRLLGTIGIPGKYYGLLIAISILNAFIAMFIMRIIVQFV